MVRAIDVSEAAAILVPLTILLTAAITDLRTRRIPNSLSYALIVLGCLWRIAAVRQLQPIETFVETLVRAAFTETSVAVEHGLSLTISLSFVIAILCVVRMLGQGRFGGGDAKLLFGLALWSGPVQLWLNLALAVALALLWRGSESVVRRAGGNCVPSVTGLPFAPFLCAGHAATLVIT